MQQSSPTLSFVRLSAASRSPWLKNRRNLILAASVPAVAALAAGWPWLTVVGAAPLLLSAAPCLAMCAAGLCMKGSGGSCSITPAPGAEAPPRQLQNQQ